MNQLLDQLEPAWETLSKQVSIPVDQLKLVLVFWIHILGGFIMNRLHGNNLRHFFSFGLGFSTLYLLYRDDLWNLLIFHVIVHRFIVTFKNKSSKITMIGMFTFLSIYHIIRMYLAYGEYVMDFTLVLMNQTTKVTYIAWAVHDFYTDEEKLPKALQGRKISKLPGLREYMSYNFTFIG